MNTSATNYASSISLASDALMHASQLIVPTAPAKPASAVAPSAAILNMASDAVALGAELVARRALSKV